MKTIYTYFKNSNTGELIIKQEFTETKIKFPINYYTANKKTIVDPDLTGYVVISEKHFNKLSKKQTK